MAAGVAAVMAGVGIMAGMSEGVDFCRELPS